MTGPRLTVTYLREKCRHLEAEVTRQRIVPDDALAAVRPGGEKNPHRSLHAWAMYHSHLFAFLERGEGRVTDGTDDAERLVMQSLGRVPVTVELLQPGPDGTRVTVEVHPKSYAVHEFVQEHDLVLAWLNGWTHRLHTSRVAERHDLAEQVATERVYQQLLLCWIATTPGPGFPEGVGAGLRPEIPAALVHLDELDILRIQQAFAQVNAGRGAALTRIIAPPKEDGTPQHARWSVFFASLAGKLGVPVAQLLRDHALPELIAQAYLAVGAEREAFEAAKKKHAADAGAEDDADELAGVGA